MGTVEMLLPLPNFQTNHVQQSILSCFELTPDLIQWSNSHIYLLSLVILADFPEPHAKLKSAKVSQLQTAFLIRRNH